MCSQPEVDVGTKESGRRIAAISYIIFAQQILFGEGLWLPEYAANY